MVTDHAALDAAAPAAQSAAAPRKLGLVITASAAGTVFEWYDFFIFGSMASIIARHFFAPAGETHGLIFALLTFAAGFAVRPLGALVFGHFGDRWGRKRTFLVTITIMGVATFAIGLLPDYESAGVTAPYLLVAMRVLQGFAVGGEYGGAATYVAEHAPAGRRGFATGWIQVSAGLGLILALGIILAIRTGLGEAAFGDWGWRLPFLISACLLLISLWIRLRLEESPMFKAIRAEGRIVKAPLSEAFLRWQNLKRVLVVLVGLLMAQGVIWYTAEFYTQFFLQNVIKVEARLVNILILAVTAVGVPLHLFFAWLSDRIGRKPVMLFGLGLAAITFVPAFQLLAEAANPALVQAAERMPVTVAAVPGECAFQFYLLGQSRFLSPCDIAKSALAGAGVPFHNEPAAPGTPTRVRIGPRTLPVPDGRGLTPEAVSAVTEFQAGLKSSLAEAGYSPAADSAAVDIPGALGLLILIVTAAAALYGPQAAALVELFPTPIRYSALSLPYHVGVGWFGGFLPAIAFAIVTTTGSIHAGLWYPVAIAALGFAVTLLFVPETRGRPID